MDSQTMLKKTRKKKLQEKAQGSGAKQDGAHSESKKIKLTEGGKDTVTEGRDERAQQEEEKDRKDKELMFEELEDMVASNGEEEDMADLTRKKR